MVRQALVVSLISVVHIVNIMSPSRGIWNIKLKLERERETVREHIDGGIGWDVDQDGLLEAAYRAFGAALKGTYYLYFLIYPSKKHTFLFYVYLKVIHMENY